MGSKIDLIETDCQIVNYRYDLNTHLRHAFIEKDRHLVEAVGSRLPFEPLETFYWLENQNDPNLRREDLRLDAEVMDNGHVLMEVHPGLFRHPEVIDLESVWFGIKCRALRQDGVFTLGEIEFILVMAFLKGNLLPRIRGGKLIIINPGLVKRDRPGPGEKKAVATAPKKRAKVKRLNVPPGDVVKYFRKEQPLISWEPVLRAMYFVSWFDPVKRRRIFNRGVEWLAAWSGISESQVKRDMARMKVRRVKEKKGLGVKGIIKLRGRGWPGEGCSRWELPCNMGLVMRWRRNLPKK